MTHSDNPHDGNGPHHGYPPQQQPGQQQPGQQPGQQPTMHDPYQQQAPQAPHYPPQGQAPAQPQHYDAAQMPPQMPQQGQPVPQGHGVPSQEVPVDDYHYPQGQAAYQQPAPQEPVYRDQGQNLDMPVEPTPAFPDPARQAAGEQQISQRLAQLQNQYDQDMSTNQWSEPQPSVDQYAAPDPAHGYAAPQPTPSQEYTGHDYHAPELGHAAPSYEQVPQQFDGQGQYDPHVGAVAPAYDQGAQGFNTHDAHQPMPASPISHEVPQSGGFMKKAMLGGAFAAALAMGGGAAYTYKYTDLFSKAMNSDAAPTIKASRKSVRIVKKSPSGADSLNKSMHDRLQSKDGLSDSSINDSVEAARARISAASAGAPSDMLNDGAKKQDGAPRRVKTLIVRPDGTIMRPAGDTPAPRVRKTTSIGVIEKAATSTGSERVKAEIDAAGNNAMPAQKRVKLSSLAPLPKKTTPPQPAQPRAVVRSAPPMGDVGSPYVVQVTSRSSQTSALAAFADMQQKYPSLMGRFGPDIQRADLGTKGVWYRLRVGPVAGKTAATDLCVKLKAAGHPGCFVRKKQ